MSQLASMTGKVLNGRYEIGERIGIGGMAEVYSAQDTVLGRMVAVKVMLPQFAEEEDFARRFRQEAAAAANLASPYIVNVYDWGHDLGTYFIVMEYVRGSDLKSAIKQRGAINQKKVAEIGSQVCQALIVAHSQDIIHRDIKPQNIMIQPDGNVKVMDFGIARAKNSVSEKTGNVLGTAHYISPEQAQGKDLTNASDIYSLGIVMYEAATGKLPFDGPDAVSVALMQVQDEPMIPSAINPEIDPALENIILKAMQKDPANRFATVQEMRSALNDYLAGRTNPSFTQQQTSVISPTSYPVNDATQVMPAVAAEQNHGNSGNRSYINSDSKAKMSNKKKAGIAIGCILGAIAVVAAIWFAFFSGGDKVEVPDVTGKTTSEATEILKAAGFEVGSINNVYDTSVESGKVVAQSPKAHNKVAKGSKINLDISQGSEKVEVPDVSGMSESEATSKLINAGFSVGNSRSENSDNFDAGKIIGTNPSAGSSVAKGSVISLIISKGADKVTVPNITGLSLSEARARAQAVGLTISQTGSDHSSQYGVNYIISQSPQAGSSVAKGSSIGYVISLGQEAIAVPNVQGYTMSGAKNSIESAGLVFDYEEVYSDTVAQGVVIGTNPSAGTKVESGTTVTVQISKGPKS